MTLSVGQIVKRVRLAVCLGGGTAVLICAHPLAAQTDFYNTSTGRPMRVEDVVPVEYRAIELDVAPLRLESFGKVRQWSLHPETTIGIFPRTQLQIGLPLTYIDATAASSRGVAGLEVSALHGLNAETAIPALAIAGDVLLPVGALGGERTYGTLKAIVTRTMPWARLHANVQFTAGPSSDETSVDRRPDARDLSRWLAGVAIDKTFPLHSLLISAESFAERPIDARADVAWIAGAGFRYQLTPRWAMDAGAGRRFAGNDRAWYLTFGSAYGLGFR